MAKWDAITNTLSAVGSEAGNWLMGGSPAGGGGSVPGYGNIAGPPAPGVTPSSPGGPGTSAMGGGGGGFDPKNALSLAGIVGQVIEGIQKMRMQSNLQDPNYIANQIQKLEAKQAPGLLQAMAPGIEGRMAEQGLATAPGMIQEAEFESIGPLLAQLSSNEYFSGVGAAQGEQPGPGFANVSNLIEQLYGQGATA